MNSINYYPENPETMDAFRRMANAPNDEKPIVEMNDETTRNMDIIWLSVEALAAKWRGDKEMHFPGMPTNRKEFWGTFASDHEPLSLPIMKEFIDSDSAQDNIESKTAIDLGCGNSPATKLLLEKGWRVIAVDNSQSALDVLIEKNKEKFQSGHLIVIKADVTTYCPSEPADLVLAVDVLPYIDPVKFRATWSKIHDTFIKQNGFLIGSIFRDTTNTAEVPAMNLLKEMGAWFLPDRRMVRPLLTHTGYVIKTCKYRIDNPKQEPICIQFVAEKTSLGTQ